MHKINLQQHPAVAAKFAAYPAHARGKLNALRNLILETAAEIQGLTKLEETLKWGEPSYLAKKGSTIRMDWKPRQPDQYALYFNCNTRLVETFRMKYGNLFKYEKNRAIWFTMEDDIPVAALKVCIKMALQYHQVKDQPMLGE